MKTKIKQLSPATTYIVQKNINILGLLGVLFVGLKLANYITWSWFFVTMPFWGPFALLITILLIAGIFGGIILAFAFALEKLTGRL